MLRGWLPKPKKIWETKQKEIWSRPPEKQRQRLRTGKTNAQANHCLCPLSLLQSGEQTLSPLFYVLMLVRMMLCLLKLCSGDVIDVLVYLSMICFLNYLEVWTCNRTCYNWWYFREFSCVMVACKKLSNFISKTQKKKYIWLHVLSPWVPLSIATVSRFLFKFKSSKPLINLCFKLKL